MIRVKNPEWSSNYRESEQAKTDTWLTLVKKTDYNMLRSERIAESDITYQPTTRE